MDDFANRVRAALAERGISMRAVARTLNYDVSYLSRVVNGKQLPSPKLAEALDQLLGEEGSLASLATAKEPAEQPDGSSTDISHMKAETRWRLRLSKSGEPHNGNSTPVRSLKKIGLAI